MEVREPTLGSSAPRCCFVQAAQPRSSCLPTITTPSTHQATCQRFQMAQEYGSTWMASNFQSSSTSSRRTRCSRRTPSPSVSVSLHIIHCLVQGTHTSAPIADVPSEKGKEFSVGYYLTGSLTADMRTATVKMDGVKAESYKLDGSHYYRELKSDGWALNPTTIRKFVFGEIDTSQGTLRLRRAASTAYHC